MRTDMPRAVAALLLTDRAIGGDGLYFLQDFENAADHPDTRNGQEQVFLGADQGEWLYCNAFLSTNSSYNENGSTMNRCMYKNGSDNATEAQAGGVPTMSSPPTREVCKRFTVGE